MKAELNALFQVASFLWRNRGNVFETRVEHDMQGQPCVVVAARTIMVASGRDWQPYVVVNGDLFSAVNVGEHNHKYVWVGQATTENVLRVERSFNEEQFFDRNGLPCGIDNRIDQLDLATRIEVKMNLMRDFHALSLQSTADPSAEQIVAGVGAPIDVQCCIACNETGCAGGFTCKNGGVPAIDEYDENVRSQMGW